MPSALEKIRDGILQQDWKLVSGGYYDLTGTMVFTEDTEAVPIKKKRGRPAKVKANAKAKEDQVQQNNEVDVEETREQIEARSQSVVTGRKPQFVKE